MAATKTADRQLTTNFRDQETLSISAGLVAVDAVIPKKYLILTQNCTVSNPTNASEAKVLTIKLRQDATGSRIVTWGTDYRFNGDLVAANVVLSTTAAKIDRIAFEYDSTDSKWDCISFIKGS